jgi:hypothetical protein
MGGLPFGFMTAPEFAGFLKKTYQILQLKAKKYLRKPFHFSRLGVVQNGLAHYTTPVLKRFLMAYFGPLMRVLPPVRRRWRNSSKPVLNHDFEQ